MAITFEGAGTVASGTGAVTPTVPAGVQANDILLLFVESANEAVSLTTAAGFASVGTPTGTGTAAATTATRLTVFWKRATGSDTDPTVGDPGNHAVARILNFRGCKTSGNPWNGTPVWSVDATADTSGAATGYTTTADGCGVVVGVANVVDQTAALDVTYSNPNFTITGTGAGDNATAGNGGGFNVGLGTQPTAGAIGTTTVTLDLASQKSMVVIALEPPVPKTTSTARVSLAAGGVPSERTTHSLNVRARKLTSAHAATMRLQLYEGATQRSAEYETANLTTSLANYELAMTDVEAAAITSYADLEIRFRGYSWAGDAAQFEVAEVWLRAPDGPFPARGRVSQVLMNQAVTRASYF